MEFKTNFDETFGVNRDYAEHGKWFKLNDEVELKIRYNLSKNVAKVRRRLEQGFKGELSDDATLKLGIRTIAQGIVVDWRGVVIDGQPVEKYDWKIMEQLLEEYPKLITVITDISSDNRDFNVVEEPEDLEKNS